MLLADYLGFIAAFCTTISFVPQVLMVYKSNDTSALSLSMYSIFTIGVALWLIYGIIKFDMAIITANTLTLALAISILFKIISNNKINKYN